MAANAASVGAKTVNGPLPSKVVTKSAVFTAAANVLALSVASATMVFEVVILLFFMSQTILQHNKIR
jgi:hypothetical protein